MLVYSLTAVTVCIFGRVVGSSDDAKPVFCTSTRYSPGAKPLNTNRRPGHVHPRHPLRRHGSFGPVGGICRRIIGKTMTLAPRPARLVPSAVNAADSRPVGCGCGRLIHQQRD